MGTKRCLIIRLGAYGDMLIISPVLERLKELGYYIILNTSQRGLDVFKHSPFVDEFIEHKEDSKTLDDLPKHWEELKKKINPDRCINFSESIECNVALHPTNSAYIYPKQERFERCNKNYYDVTTKWANLENCRKRPILHFTEKEERKAWGIVEPLRENKKFIILWCLSGSGKNKVYPWTEYVMGEVLKNYDDTHFITTGDMKCQLLETVKDPAITNLSGELDIRTSMCLTKMVDLVISPDTGILHASGCYMTPKIGLLGHTTKKNVTEYFLNDYSIEAECSCAPCFHLIYSYEIQCPIDPITRASFCMAVGLPPERVYEQIKKVINEKRNMS